MTRDDRKPNAPSPDSAKSDEGDRRVGESLSDEDLDPTLIARLAAWFGGPAPPAADEVDDPAVRAIRDTRQRALDAVEPGFLTALENQGERAGRITHAPSPPAAVIDPSIAKFDLEAWGVAEAEQDWYEHEQAERIRWVLRENVPQAILRDLHRSERSFGSVFLEETNLGLDVGGTRARELVSETLRASYTIRMDEEPIPRTMIAEDMAALSQSLTEPWDQIEVKPRRASAMPDINDMLWFGTGASDD